MKIFLEELGIPIVEHCNLNCKGCLHFCHKGQKPYFYNLKKLCKDIRKLSEFCRNIRIIRIYGGEPLLHKDLSKIIINIKNIFPQANIEIFTNGILLMQMNRELRKTIVENKVKICWSVYPIIYEQKYNKICDFLTKNKIIYIATKINEFYTCLDLEGKIDKNEAFEKCSGKNCHVLRDGKISCCPAPLVGHYINEFGANIDFSDGILDIYEAKSAEEILEFLKKPHNACRYCSAPKFFKWQKQGENVCLDDWKKEHNG